MNFSKQAKTHLSAMPQLDRIGHSNHGSVLTATAHQVCCWAQYTRTWSSSILLEGGAPS